MTELANSKKQYQKSVLWLLLLITIGILIIYFQFLFKGTPYLFWTSGSDTRDSYLMKYSGIVNKIVSGDTALSDISFRDGQQCFNEPKYGFLTRMRSFFM